MTIYGINCGHCRSFGKLGTPLAASGRRQAFLYRWLKLTAAVPLHLYWITKGIWHCKPWYSA